MYTDRDKEAILEDMLNGTRDDVDKREGAIVYDMLTQPSEEHEMLGYALDAILENGFIDTAQAQYVDRRAEELGEDRKPALQATGWVLIHDRKDTPVEIGTEIIADRDGELISLQTTEYAVIPEIEEVMVPVVAIEGGANGNVTAYSNLSSTALPNAIITNPVEFIGGVDAESDEELKERYLLKVRKPITSGNIYHYELWAREVAGISQARVSPLWDGPGTVKVTVINSEGRAPTAEQVEAVYEHINRPDKKPIGATVTVVAIKEVPIEIAAVLTLEGGLLAEDVHEAVQQSISEYLAEAGTEIRYSQIARAILRTDGVEDYDNVQIGVNGIMDTANILISADDVAVVGEVTLA